MIWWAKLAIVAAVFAAGVWTGYSHEHDARVAEVAQMRADAAEAVLERQREVQRANQQTVTKLQADKARVTGALRSSLERLRDYSPDVPACAAASAAGSDAGTAPIVVPRPNAEAALALAAEADAIVAQLRACQSYVRSLGG